MLQMNSLNEHHKQNYINCHCIGVGAEISAHMPNLGKYNVSEPTLYSRIINLLFSLVFIDLVKLISEQRDI